MPPWLHTLFGGLAVLGLGWLPPAVQAQEVGEYELKAAYLYNFALFTTWPSEAMADKGQFLYLCVLGTDPLGPALDALAGKRVQERRIAVRRLAAPEEAPGCHVLYLHGGEREAPPRFLDVLRQAPVLTVTDAPEPWRREMAIHLAIERGRLVFEVNLEPVQRARLTLSSRLLQLARKVH